MSMQGRHNAEVAEKQAVVVAMSPLSSTVSL